MDNGYPAGVTGNEPIFQDARHQPASEAEELETIAELLDSKPDYWEWVADAYGDLLGEPEFIENLTNAALANDDLNSAAIPLQMLRRRLHSMLNEKATEWKEEELADAEYER